MSTVQVKDDGGDEMTLYQYNGNLYPDFPFETKAVVNLPSVKIRSDDIIIVAFPKSGTHWMYEILRFLIAGEVDNEDISKVYGMIECVGEETYRDVPSPRILDTHLLFRQLPEEVKSKKPKLIYIDRNPKDVMVSYYNFVKKIPFFYYKGKWKNYLKPALEGKFEYGSWFDYVREWEEVKKTTDIPILSLNFEDMKEDLMREIKKIREFLNLKRTDEFLEEVCEHSGFHIMKGKGKQRSDIIFRKGQVGDWKNWFTVTQNEWFDQLYQEKMKDCPLTFRYTL